MDCELQKAIERVKNSKYCFGICSNNRNGHVLFFDFDGDITLKQVEESLKELILKYKLADVVILKSDNGYNAFCLNVVSLKVAYHILTDTKYICKDFVRLGYEKRKFYVLRMSWNKHYLKTLCGYTDNMISNAHVYFFKEIMNFPINDNLGHYDKTSAFKLIAYKSTRHGVVDLDD
jgi:hypothetical protein